LSDAKEQVHLKHRGITFAMMARRQLCWFSGLIVKTEKFKYMPQNEPVPDRQIKIIEPDHPDYDRYIEALEKYFDTDPKIRQYIFVDNS
jgi:hypothetical protein